jgi:hypothetical protein
MSRLAESDRSNAEWQRDLSFALTRLAELYELQAEPFEALPLAETSLAIDERLAALDRTKRHVAERRGVYPGPGRPAAG